LIVDVVISLVRFALVCDLPCADVDMRSVSLFMVMNGSRYRKLSHGGGTESLAVLHRFQFDTVDQRHLSVQGLDVDAADCAKRPCQDIDVVGDGSDMCRVD
jgi:hypothetical protein